MNKLFQFFFFILALCAHANKIEYDIFDAIKKDEVDAIRAFVEKDPAVLESIYGGGQKGITVYRSGRTPLLYAVLEGKSQAVKTLLELGADVHATEQDGYNVLHAAGTQGRVEVLEILMDHFSENSIDMNITTDQHADGFYPLHRACWGTEARHTETVKAMLKMGVPFDLPSKSGKTCVQLTQRKETIMAIADAAKEILAADNNTEL